MKKKVGKMRKLLMVGIVVGLMTIPTFVGGVVEASQGIDGKCTLTIDASKHLTAETTARATGKCSKVVSGLYYPDVGAYQMIGGNTTYVHNNQVIKVIIPPFETYEVTVYTVPLKDTIEEERPEVKVSEPVEVEAYEGEEEKGKEEKEDKVTVTKPLKEEEVNFYTLEELTELKKEERLSFNGVGGRYYAIIDEKEEQEITEDYAIELGYLSIEDVGDKDAEEIVELEELESVDIEDYGDGVTKEVSTGVNYGVIVAGLIIIIGLGTGYLYYRKKSEVKE